MKIQLEQKEGEVADLCNELEESKQKMQSMKETTVKSKQEQDKLQMSNSNLKFELAEQIGKEETIAKLWRQVGGLEREGSLVRMLCKWQRREETMLRKLRLKFWKPRMRKINFSLSNLSYLSNWRR